MDNPSHVSVLLNECIDNLDIKENGIYVDGTLGLGGHSLRIAEKLSKGRLICIDKDERAIAFSKNRLKNHLDKVTFVHDDFRNVSSIIDELGICGVDGMLFDLGVSSPQLDDAQRGFSYMLDAPLDMRMDETSSITAYSVVNGYDENTLTKIFFEFGEEKYSRKISSAICQFRMNKPVETTFELVDIIKSSMPASALREKQHPAKRCFQAIRIAVNDELGAVSQMMDTAPDKLNKGGRICVISFHSLEDRIVKNKIRSREDGCICPRELPVCVCGFKQTLKSINHKPITPSQEEIDNNPRARSAKLRVAEHV